MCEGTNRISSSQKIKPTDAVNSINITTEKHLVLYTNQSRKNNMNGTNSTLMCDGTNSINTADHSKKGMNTISSRLSNDKPQQDSCAFGKNTGYMSGISHNVEVSNPVSQQERCCER